MHLCVCAFAYLCACVQIYLCTCVYASVAGGICVSVRLKRSQLDWLNVTVPVYEWVRGCMHRCRATYAIVHSHTPLHLPISSPGTFQHRGAHGCDDGLVVDTAR